MAVLGKIGFVDTYINSHLNWVTGSTHPAPPAGVFLGLYTSMPLSDGTGGTEVTGTRPAITLGSPVNDLNGYTYTTHAAAINNVALTNANANGVLVGYGLFAAATGGTPYFIGELPYPASITAKQSFSIPAGALRVYAHSII